MATLRKGRRAVFPLMALACVLAVPPASPAATLLVPGAHPTIQAAIDASGPGDTVLVAPGTYREKLFIVGRTDLTIAGAGRLETVIASRFVRSDDVPAVYVAASSGIRITGIGFRGGHTGLVVTRGSSVVVEACSFRRFRKGGAFVGELPCAPLVTCDLKVPVCYLEDRLGAVDSSRLEMLGSVVSDNGVFGRSGTGLAYFPGTTGLVRDCAVNRNMLTGLFIWGAQVDVEGSRFRGNVEHGVEYRVFPSPLEKDGLILRAGGTLAGSSIRKSLPLPDGRLGGGLVTQGADLLLSENVISGNSAWGISACRDSDITLVDNAVSGNGQAGIVLQGRTTASISGGGRLSGNGYEGLVAMGKVRVQVDSVEIRDNGRYGVLFQNRSEGHLNGVTVSGNGTGSSSYGGVAYATGSWGSVSGSEIGGHQGGSGVRYWGSAHDLAVTGNVISGNERSGLVFDGPDARGAVEGNSFGVGNAPYDVACPNGGSPSLLGQPEGLVDVRCAVGR